MSIKKNIKTLDIKQAQAPLLVLYKKTIELNKESMHLEDIAVETKAMFPSFFCWSKYKENIDLRQVMRTLDSLKKEGLLIGSNTSSWSLSSAGYDYCHKLDNFEIKESPKLKRQHGDYYKFEINRIITSDAYIKFQNNQIDRITNQDIKYVFRIDSYNNNEDFFIRNKEKLLKAASFNKNLLEFIYHMINSANEKKLIKLENKDG